MLENLHIHELNSMALLYREDGLSFLGDYHLPLEGYHANEDLYSKRTLLLGH